MFSILKKITTSRCDRINQLLLLPSLIQTPKGTPEPKKNSQAVVSWETIGYSFNWQLPSPQSPRSFIKTGNRQDPEDAAMLNISFPQLYSAPCVCPAVRLGQWWYTDITDGVTGTDTLAQLGESKPLPKEASKSDWESPELLKQFRCPTMRIFKYVIGTVIRNIRKLLKHAFK